MRLIDADKIRWKEGFYDMHTGEQFPPMMFNTPEWLEWATAEATVKAIPIEFIKDKINDYRYIMARSTEKVAKAYLNEVRALETLISNWERFGTQWERENESRDTESLK